MAGKDYRKEVNRQLDYFATWLPGVDMKLGDVGIFQKGRFLRETDLKSQGIPFNVRIDKTGSDFNFVSDCVRSSKFGSDISASIDNKAIKNAGLKLVLDFQKKHSLVFATKGNRIHSIKNWHRVGQKIKELYDRGKWDQNWHVITEIVMTDSSTILFSGTKGATIEFAPKVSAGIQNVEIADASLEWASSNSHGFAVEVVGKKDFLPLFMARRIKKADMKIRIARNMSRNIMYGEGVFMEISPRMLSNEKLFFKKTSLADIEND